MKMKVMIIGVSVSLLYGDGNTTGIVIVQPNPNGQPPITQIERVKANSKVIDELFTKIENRIEHIEKLRKSIENILANHEEEVLCDEVESLEMDIKTLTQELSEAVDSQEKIRLEEKLDVYQSVLKSEKDSLSNYQCEPLESI